MDVSGSRLKTIQNLSLMILYVQTTWALFPGWTWQNFQEALDFFCETEVENEKSWNLPKDPSWHCSSLERRSPKRKYIHIYNNKKKNNTTNNNNHHQEQEQEQKEKMATLF